LVGANSGSAFASAFKNGFGHDRYYTAYLPLSLSFAGF
jgi:hypothetical protein